jgi:hypothetical protein
VERLIIDIPEEKSSLVKQILNEFGVIILPGKKVNRADLRKKLANVSVWSDDDLRVFEKKGMPFEILTDIPTAFQ